MRIYCGAGIENESFIRVSHELRCTGTTNHDFMFEINNPDLELIDPYSENLTDDEKVAVITEIRNNLWYFLRILRYKSQFDDKILKYELTNGLTAACWCFLNNRNFYLRGDRQTYKTWGLLAGPILWSFITQPKTRASIISDSTANSRRNLSVIKYLLKYLPKYVYDILCTDDALLLSKSTSSILSNVVNTSISVLTTPRGENAAKYVGTGISSNIIFIDDAEYIKNFKTIYDSLMPGYVIAKATLGRGCVMMASTKNWDYDLQGRLIPDLMIPWANAIYDINSHLIDRTFSNMMRGNDRLFPVLYLDFADNWRVDK